MAKRPDRPIKPPRERARREAEKKAAAEKAAQKASKNRRGRRKERRAANRTPPSPVRGHAIESWKQLEALFGVPRINLQVLLDNGVPPDLAVGARPYETAIETRLPAEIDGRRIETADELLALCARRAPNRTAKRIWALLHAGFSVPDAVDPSVTLPPKISVKALFPVSVDGVEYGSPTEAAEAAGLDYYEFTHRLRRGWSVEDAFRTPSGKDNPRPVKRPNRRGVRAFGKNYRSRTACAEAHGIDPSSFADDLEKGMKAEESIERLKARE